MALTGTIRIPFGMGEQTFSRDSLATAILLHLDAPGDPMAVRRALINDYDMSPSTANYLAVGARICVERGIEP
jgi:hypothetical protein